jgi:pyroglutamyl-peptidase
MKNRKFIIIILFIFLLFSSFSQTIPFSIDNYILQNNNNNVDNVVLITGFGPFDIYDINPSQLIVEELDGKFLEEVKIIGIILPVDFEESVNVLVNFIEENNPLFIISIGLSPSAKKIELEKIGINLKQSRNNGNIWTIPRLIDQDGPLFRISPIDFKQVLNDLRDSNIESKQSYFAGLYVCNTVLYQLLGYIENNNLTIKSGFIHVPLLDSQNPDGMNIQIMINAIEISIINILNQI